MRHHLSPIKPANLEFNKTDILSHCLLKYKPAHCFWKAVCKVCQSLAQGIIAITF